MRTSPSWKGASSLRDSLFLLRLSYGDLGFPISESEPSWAQETRNFGPISQDEQIEQVRLRTRTWTNHMDSFEPYRLTTLSHYVMESLLRGDPFEKGSSKVNYNLDGA